jgi:hypothetical protein
VTPTSTTLSLGGPIAEAWPMLLALITRNAAPIAGTVALLLLTSTVVAWKRGKIRRALIYASFAMSLGINAEGMWVVATQRLNLVPQFAVGVFAVFETYQITSMSLASDQYKRTTVRDADGRVIKAGHPGKHGRAAFAFAFVFGLIVAINSHSAVEVALRLVLPVAVVVLWWNDLTAEGTGRPKSRLAWTPTRLAERLGMLVPDVDDDLAAMARDRKVRALVRVGLRVHGGGRFERLHERRLTRLARAADDDMVAEVEGHVRRALSIGVRIKSVRTDARNPDRNPTLTGHLSGPSIEPVTNPRSGHLTNPSAAPSLAASPNPAVRPNATALKVARLRGRHPDATQAVIAKKAGVSVATVARYWQAIPPAAQHPKANGHEVPELAAEAS